MHIRAQSSLIENPGKPKLGDRLMKGLCDQSSPQMGVPLLQMISVGSHSTSGREKEGIKERTGNVEFCSLVLGMPL